MRNFTSKLIGEAGVRVLSSLFLFLLAHRVGVVQFGLYSTAFSFASLFAILVDLGTNSIVAREVARDVPNRSRLLRTANLVKLIAALFAFLAIHVAGYEFEFVRAHRRLVDSMGIIAIVYALTEHGGALLAGREEMGWEACLKISSRGIVVASGLLVLYRTDSLTAITSAMALGSLGACVAGLWILYNRFGHLGLGEDLESAKKLIKSSLPLLGFVVFWTFYDNQDILLLKHFRVPDQEIGLFWSATKVIDVMKVFPVLLAGAFFPSLARLAATRESFMKKTRALLFYSLLAIPVLVLGVYWIAPLLETLLYGPAFSKAVPLLRILLLAFAAIFLNGVLMQILIAKDYEMKLLAGALVAFLSNFLFSWIFIPTQGTIGACYALVFSETLYLVFQGRLLVQAVPGILNPFRRTYG